MTFNDALFSSKRMDWRTPKALYAALDMLFGFDFDPCPVAPTFDGLTVEWGASNYMNPPYGTEIGKWIKKGYEQSRKGKVVVMLIPSRTDTRYWHDYIMKANEVWFLKGRLKFDDQKSGAPFPSAIVIFRGHPSETGLPVMKAMDTDSIETTFAEET
jgi:hypothetical protein